MSLSDPTLATERKVTIEITVNHVIVVLHKARVTGAEIKEAAIAAGVPIDLTFKVSMEGKKGAWQIIGDNEPVKVKDGAVFRAVASDDNS
jgi:hypothetical protein